MRRHQQAAGAQARRQHAPCAPLALLPGLGAEGAPDCGVDGVALNVEHAEAQPGIGEAGEIDDLAGAQMRHRHPDLDVDRVRRRLDRIGRQRTRAAAVERRGDARLRAVMDQRRDAGIGELQRRQQRVAEHQIGERRLPGIELPHQGEPQGPAQMRLGQAQRADGRGEGGDAVAGRLDLGARLMKRFRVKHGALVLRRKGGGQSGAAIAMRCDRILIRARRGHKVIIWRYSDDAQLH